MKVKLRKPPEKFKALSARLKRLSGIKQINIKLGNEKG
jgi:hypothetical protein